MSESNPFGGGPLDDLMRNLARLFTNQGPVNWEIAQQMATYGASGGQSEANPDPLARVRLEELLRVADLQVADATGLATSTGGILKVRAATRVEWAQRTLDAWKPLLERLAAAMGDLGGTGPDPTEGAGTDPMSQLFANLPQVLGPFLFGMQVGAMVGDLASRAMGQYDLPMPRPANDELLIVPSTIDSFATDWSLPADDVRLWVCLREITHHAVLSRPHIRARIDGLLGDYAGAFHPDPRALEERLSGLDPTDLSSLQSALGDPESLLGEMQTDEQRRIQAPLQALLSVITGYSDHVMTKVGTHLISSYGPLTEALHRRRLEEGQGQRILSKLLGFNLDEAGYERGQRFIAGVVERAGDGALMRLWGSEQELPTPAEVDAPGLWLARIDLPTD
jgi:putative hydrolase